MEYIITLILGYLSGSFPSAYILLKKTRGMDITRSGTGNAGAMNTYEVSGSKVMGIVVLLLDLFKGMLSAYLPQLLFQNDFTLGGIGLLAAVLSHCFNPWLDFKGGRGLATAAGGVIVLFPLLLLIWLVLWAIIYYLKKDIHFGNIMASILSLLIVFNLASTAYKYTFPRAESVSELVFFVAALFNIILIKHFDPLRDILNNPKFFQRKRK